MRRTMALLLQHPDASDILMLRGAGFLRLSVSPAIRRSLWPAGCAGRAI